MPQDFRNKLIAIMVCNTVAVVAWDYFVVNGIRRPLAAKKQGCSAVNARAFLQGNDTEKEGTDEKDTF